ncbi:unnamed protein product, partial [Adineta ricciae]
MNISPRTRKLIKLTVLCTVILWLLGVLSGFVAMFLPQNGATSTALIGFTDDKNSTITTLNYETLMDHRRFVISQDLLIKFRKSTACPGICAPSTNDTNLKWKTLLTIETQITYPISCNQQLPSRYHLVPVSASTLASLFLHSTSPNRLLPQPQPQPPPPPLRQQKPPLQLRKPSVPLLLLPQQKPPLRLRTPPLPLQKLPLPLRTPLLPLRTPL